MDITLPNHSGLFNNESILHMLHTHTYIYIYTIFIIIYICHDFKAFHHDITMIRSPWFVVCPVVYWCKQYLYCDQKAGNILSYVMPTCAISGLYMITSPSCLWLSGLVIINLIYIALVV